MTRWSIIALSVLACASLEYGEALDNCNADKAGLRVWRQAADEDLSHD